MYQALYRKYRPKAFEDVVGQDIIIKTLSNSILNNKISHAYLFTGPRGTGKTSIAKILAKIVNCKNLNGTIPCDECDSCIQINNRQSVDIIEIDAASNNGVDEIRELRDKVNLVPSFGKYKVYIIDEVHMLTTAAFNALLKTLEEPPKHIIFILATTEPHKIPSTILSRCQRFDFKKIGIPQIEKRLSYICLEEKIKIDDNALKLIAKLSDGGMRDSISLLDQLSAYTADKITVEDVNNVSGIITKDEIFDLIQNIYDRKLVEVFGILEKYDNLGKNLSKIAEFIIDFLKNVLIYYDASDYFESEEEKNMYEVICTKTSKDTIFESINILLGVIKDSKNTSNVELLLELGIIRILQIENISQTSFKENIPIFEEKKKTPATKPNFEKKDIDSELRQKIDEIKKIMINNTLFAFNKKELTLFKSELDKISELLMNPDYSSKTSLVLDGELKAKGNKNLIFVYKTKSLEEYFNSSLADIEKIFMLSFDIDYKPIAVCDEEWQKIKLEYNQNIKENKNAYEYIEEKKIVEDKSNTIKNKVEKDKIEEMFENIIEYS